MHEVVGQKQRRLRLGHLIAALTGVLIVRALQLAQMVGLALAHPWDSLQGPADLYTYLTAADLVRAGAGARIYDASAFAAAQVARGLDNPLPYPYHAAWLVLILPLSYLPVGAAYLAWLAVDAAFLAAALALLCRAFIPRGQRLLFVILVLISQPVLLTAKSGQSTFILLLALTIVVIGIREQRDAWTGLGLAAMLIKPQLIPLIVLLLAYRRRWRALAWLVAGGLAILIVSIGLVGIDGLYGYARLLTDGRMSFAFPWSHTLLGLTTSLLGGSLAFPVYLLLAALVLAIFGRALTGGKSDDEGQSVDDDNLLALAVLGALLISPYAFVYDLVLWTVPAALCWQRLRRGKGIILLIAGLLAPLLAMADPVIRQIYDGRGAAVWLTVMVALAGYLIVAQGTIRASANESGNEPRGATEAPGLGIDT